MSNMNLPNSNWSISSPMAPLVYNSRTQDKIYSHDSSGKSSSQITWVYVERDKTLKTKMKAPASIDKIASFCMFWRMALKILVNSDISVNMSNM